MRRACSSALTAALAFWNPQAPCPPCFGWGSWWMWARSPRAHPGCCARRCCWESCPLQGARRGWRTGEGNALSMCASARTHHMDTRAVQCWDLTSTGQLCLQDPPAPFRDARWEADMAPCRQQHRGKAGRARVGMASPGGRRRKNRAQGFCFGYVHLSRGPRSCHPVDRCCASAGRARRWGSGWWRRGWCCLPASLHP